MSGPVKYDSISKCSQGNDLYAMIRNPNARMSPKAAPTKPVDTLESRMERKALARLGEITKNFIVVGRAGKFVFLALMMPPYFLLYGLPKWMLSELPNLFSYSLKPFQGFTEKIKKLFKPNENDKGVINSLRNAWATASAKAAEYIQWISRTSEALFVHLKHQVVALGYRFLQPYMPALQKSFEAAEAITMMLLKKTYEKGDKHIDVARQFVSFAWKIAKQEFANQFRPYVELVKNQFNSLRKQLKRLIEKPRLEIQKFKTDLTHKLKRTTEVLKSAGLKISKEMALVATATVSYVARPIIEWVAPKIQWSAAALQTGRERMAYNFEQIRSFVQNLASAAIDAARMSRHVVINAMKKAFETVIPASVRQFFNPEGGFKKKYQQMLQNLGQKFKKLKNSSLQHVADGLNAAKSQFLTFMRKVVECFNFLGRQIKQLPKRIVTVAVKSYRLGIYSSLQMGYFLRWVIVWSRVLGRLAWQELRDSTALIINISKKNSP